MYIITRAKSIEKNEIKIYRVEAPELENEYINAGYKKSERAYKIKYERFDYIVYCPEFRNNEKGNEPIVIIPDFLLIKRHYQIEVYLYAIELYSKTTNKGQRWAAESTRKKFGLITFAHTTLGRALKTLIKMLDECEKPVKKSKDQPEGAEENIKEELTDGKKETDSEELPDCMKEAVNEEASEGGKKTVKEKPQRIPTVQTTATLRERAAKFIREAASVKKDKELDIADYRKIAREWFEIHNRLLL